MVSDVAGSQSSLNHPPDFGDQLAAIAFILLSLQLSWILFLLSPQVCVVQEAKHLPYCFPLVWESLDGWVSVFPGSLLGLKPLSVRNPHYSGLCLVG